MAILSETHQVQDFPQAHLVYVRQNLQNGLSLNLSTPPSCSIRIIQVAQGLNVWNKVLLCPDLMYL